MPSSLTPSVQQQAAPVGVPHITRKLRLRQEVVHRACLGKVVQPDVMQRVPEQGLDASRGLHAQQQASGHDETMWE